MKTRLLTILALIILAITITSCYSSRKSGCPMNPQSNYKYRG
ncbi:MAG: hypothetical protein Q8941_07335 [Bacteroidota bacterium]|nr:hypothetical protein [Bacteroidota bacterium]